MSLIDYWTTIAFYSIIVILVYINRNKFDKYGIQFLYRTKFGLNLMDKISSRYQELVKIIGYCGIGVGYLGMVIIFYILVASIKVMILKPPVVEGSPFIIPGVPIQGMGGAVFPLVMGWIALFVIIVIHEFSHGIVARAHNIKVKSSGIAFFGPIMGAFVEPDDEQLKKAPDIVQYSVFAAGPVSNFLLTVFILFLLVPGVGYLQDKVTEPVGVMIGAQEGLPATDAGIADKVLIEQINGNRIYDSEDFNNQLKTLLPGEEVVLSTESEEFTIIATENPDDVRKGYLGVWLYEDVRNPIDSTYDLPNKALNWLADLLFWIWFISLNLGLINLLPIFITDGAQMTRLSFSKILKKGYMPIWKNLNLLTMAIVLMIVIFPFARSLLTILI